VTRRVERVAQEIREEVARILGREIKDPRIGFVTVTRVELTPDLHLARVFVGVLGEAERRRKTMQGLQQAAGYVRRTLGHRLRLRFTPDVLFQYDEGLEATDRVSRLLDQVQSDGQGDGRGDGQSEGRGDAQDEGGGES